MEKRKWQTENFWKSFKCAITGMVYSVKTGRNLIIQLCFALFAIILGIFLKISKIEWAIIIFAILFVIFAEMLNTAVETVVDLVTEEYNEKAKIAKDISAGGVTLVAVASVIIGLIIFLPKILKIVL